jgi:hypothetical protein
MVLHEEPRSPQHLFFCGLGLCTFHTASKANRIDDLWKHWSSRAICTLWVGQTLAAERPFTFTRDLWLPGQEAQLLSLRDLPEYDVSTMLEHMSKH